MERRELTTLGSIVVLSWEGILKNDRFMDCLQGGDTSFFTQTFLGSRDSYFTEPLTEIP